LGALQLLAGLWAGVRIVNESRGEAPVIGRPLRLAGLVLSCCGFVWGVPVLMGGGLYYVLQPASSFAAWAHGIEPLMAALFLIFLTSALSVEAIAGAGQRFRFRRSTLMLWTLPVLAVCLLGSLKIVSLAGDYGDRSQREVRLSRVRTAIAAVNPIWVGELEGSAADTGKPDYGRLCDQLRLIRETDEDTRFVYLLGRKEGRIVFLAESEPADSPDHSPPGQVYDEAPPALAQVFETGRSYVHTQLEDRWGVWESAFAPLRMPDRRSILAVLGMDMDAGLKRQHVARYRLVGIGLSFVLNLLVLALFTGLHVSRKSARAAAASESRFRTMFENAPEAVFVFDAESGRILAANPYMAVWLGFSQAELYGSTVQDLVAGTLEQIRSRILRGRDADPAGSQDFVFRRKDGLCMPAETTGDALRFQEADSVVVFARDVTERRLAESELSKRGVLLKGLAEAARILLTGDDYADTIHRALAAMGKAAGVDAAYVFENHSLSETNEAVASRRFGWRNESLPEGASGFSDLQTLSFVRFQRWLFEFSAGRSVSGPVRELPRQEYELLELYGVRSLVTVPIMIDGRLWGFIGFDDCRFERQWSEAEISIVRAAASSIGGAIKRRDAEERLQKSLSELERFNRLMVGRETRVVELKREINGLLRSLNRPAAYSSVEPAAAAGGEGEAG
jgi:PAS domain S-box-containing protein